MEISKTTLAAIAVAGLVCAGLYGNKIRRDMKKELSSKEKVKTKPHFPFKGKVVDISTAREARKGKGS